MGLPFVLVEGVPVFAGIEQDQLVGLQVPSGEEVSFDAGDVVGFVSIDPAAVFWGAEMQLVRGEQRIAAEARRAGRYKPRGQLFEPLPPEEVSGFPSRTLLQHRSDVPSLDTIRLSALFAVSTVRTSIEQAEKSFNCFVELYEAAGRELPGVSSIKMCFRGLQNSKSRMFAEVAAYAPVVRSAIGQGLRDRELRRYLARSTDLPAGLGVSKLSFTLALLGQDCVCLDARILTRIFGSRDRATEVESGWRKSGSRVSESALQRYEAVEDAFIQGNPFYRPNDPLGRARAQWMSWESVGGRGATHSVWLNVVTRERRPMAAEIKLAAHEARRATPDVRLWSSKALYETLKANEPAYTEYLNVNRFAPGGSLWTLRTIEPVEPNVYPRAIIEWVDSREVSPNRLVLDVVNHRSAKLFDVRLTYWDNRGYGTFHSRDGTVDVADMDNPEKVLGSLIDKFRGAISGVREATRLVAVRDERARFHGTIPDVREASAARPMSSRELYEWLAANEPAYTEYLNVNRHASGGDGPWTLHSVVGPTGEGETILTWTSGRHRLTLVVLAFSGNSVSARLFLDDEQPQLATVTTTRLDDPQALLGRLVSKYEGRIPGVREDAVDPRMTPAKFSAIYLAVAEMGDVSYVEEFENDPRVPILAGALARVGVTSIDSFLGYGSFGVAARLPNRSVVKLTGDVDEVQVGAVLVGKRLPNVVAIHGSWYVRGVRANVEIGWDDEHDLSIRKRVRVGLLIEQLVSTEEVQGYDYGAPGRHLTEVVYDFKERTGNDFASYVKLSLRRKREKLAQASVELEEVLRRTGRPLERDVADALAQLRSVGVYAIDVHGNNVGWDPIDRRYRVFDVGVGSPPPDAVRPGSVGGGKRRERMAAEAVAPTVHVTEI
jgi:hypothetical protein